MLFIFVLLDFVDFLFSRFIWETVSWLWANSEVTVKWTIPENTAPGIYRIRHFGHFKYLGNNRLGRYLGTSETFKVTEN